MAQPFVPLTVTIHIPARPCPPVPRRTLAEPRSALPTLTWNPESIRALRKRLGYTQDEFAEALGYSRKQSVSDLENGKMEPSGPALRLLDHLEQRGDLPRAEST